MSKFKVGDKVRALAKPSDPFYSNEGYFKGGEEFTVLEVFDDMDTVTLVERGQCWHESRFELVEEVKPVAPVVPQLPGIPEGFRAVRIGTPKRGEWYVNVGGCAEQGDGCHSASCYVLLEKIDQPAPVEQAKPETPVAPAKKVAPVFKVGDKVRLVDNRNGYEKFLKGTEAKVRSISPNCVPVEGDLLRLDGALEASNGMFAYRFELVEEDKPEVPAMPKIKKGDKVKCLRSGLGYTAGKVYTLLNDYDSDKRLVFKDDDGDTRYRSWDKYEFELVTESPDDLVIQDRVPAREGIDFGWNILDEEFDKFVPGADHWGIFGQYAGRMHGCVGGMYGNQENLRLAVMCYRKDLPVLPTTEKVLFTEYVCWDDNGPKSIWWMDADPAVETDDYSAFDHAHPTGNTREVEVPIVKP